MTEQEIQQRVGQLLLTIWQMDKTIIALKAELDALKAAASKPE